MSKEATWTWEDFYEALKKVKDYTGKDYVWSDGFGFGSTMNIAATVYGVTGGYSTDGGDWGLKDGVNLILTRMSSISQIRQKNIKSIYLCLRNV